MHRTRLRAPALACAAALFSGCFAYVPTQIGSVRDGAQIRVHLNPSAQIEMSTQTGRRIEETLDGTLTGRQQDQLELQVPVAAQQEGFFRSDIAQKVQVPTPGVVGVDVRTFSTSRTALLVAGGVAITGAVVGLIVSSGGRANPGTPGGPDEIRIPLASFSVR